jgi:hypothetical protein
MKTNRSEKNNNKDQYKKVNKPPFIHLAILIGLVLVTRVPFASKVLFNWDSVNFALATDNFNVIKHQPHPPGYFLYVFAGKALNLMTGDPNTSYVFISIIACALLVLLTYLLGREIFGEDKAFIAGILVVVNPLVWFYSEVALTYVLDGVFTTAIAFACYMILMGSRGWVYVGAILLGLAGGFRQTTLLFMLPLCVYSIRHTKIKHIIGAGIVLMLIGISWGFPLITASGGLSSYFIEMRRISSVLEQKSLVSILSAIIMGGNLALLLLLGPLSGKFKASKERHFRDEGCFLALWILPSLIVTVFFHYGQPGYILYLIPPLAIYTPSLIRGFLVWLSTKWPGQSMNTRNEIEQKFMLTVGLFILIGIMLSYVGMHRIRINDRYWAEIEGLPNTYIPAETMVLSNVIDFRQHGYNMPNYHVYGWAVAELDGPYRIEGPQSIPAGWIYHAHQREDNYDLNPETHPLHTSLALPPKITGLIITDYVLASSLRYPDPEQSLLLEPISEEFWNLIYVKLPEDASEIVLMNGELIIQ